MVLIFHIWPGRLPGGYVGVDVFFVISGFLISSHLLAEIATTSSLSLSRFYARRIRRLLPAALTVLVVCAISVAIWPPVTLVRSLQEIMASAVYGLNWLLAFNAVDYMSAGSPHTLVQHYWSLSVEEQFYLLWPLLLLALVGLTRHRSIRARQMTILVALCVVFVISLTYSVGATFTQPASAYFSTFTRAWEFAAGGILAIFFARPGFMRSDRGELFRSLCGWVGLALIVASGLLLGADSPFPGILALIPVAGTFLIILGGAPGGAWSITRSAKFGPVQLVGGISYPLYLWHWPLILVLPTVAGPPEREISGLVVVGLAVLLAILTKLFIEDPVRRGRFWASRRWPSYTFAAAGMAIVLTICGAQWVQFDAASSRVAAAIKQLSDNSLTGGCVGAAAMIPANACSSPFEVTDTVDPSFALTDRADISRCQQNQESVDLLTCEFGDTTDPRRTIALLGDSHAEQWIWAIAPYAKERNWSIRTFIKSSCPVVDRAMANVRDECVVWSTAAIRAITTDSSIDTVIYSNRADFYPELQEADLIPTLRALAGSGKQVVVIRDTPGSAGVSIPECLAGSSAKDDPCSTPRGKVVGDSPTLRASREADTAIVDLTGLFCNSATCHSVIGGLVVYGDQGGHMTISFATTLASFMGEKLAAIMEKD